ncbi:hypothetical protein D3C71_1782530 [compost metagenome]
MARSKNTLIALANGVENLNRMATLAIHPITSVKARALAGSSWLLSVMTAFCVQLTASFWNTVPACCGNCAALRRSIPSWLSDSRSYARGLA